MIVYCAAAVCGSNTTRVSPVAGAFALAAFSASNSVSTRFMSAPVGLALRVS